MPDLSHSKQSASQIPEELKLADYIDKIRGLKGFGALHIHLSKLIKDPVKSQSYQVGLRSFEKFTQHFDAQLFKLNSGDLVYVFSLDVVEDIKKIALKLKDIFSLNDTKGASVLQSDCFKIYNLDIDCEAFFVLIQSILDRAGLVGFEKRFKKEEPKEPLTLHKLEKLEQGLSNVNLAPFLRQQPICLIHNGQIVKTIFREFYVSINDFSRQVLPDTNLKSSMLLFRYLLRLLDRQVLYSLEKMDQRFFDSSFSLNLNVETIFSPAFGKFHQSVKSLAHGTIAIEFDLSDIFVDLSSFVQVKQILKKYNYKFILDGVGARALPYVQQDCFGYDILKLLWHPSMADAEEIQMIRESLKMIKPERIVLYRCDSPLAIEVGQKLGISLFQGLYVQYLQERSKS
jgi:hypothetical protein